MDKCSPHPTSPHWSLSLSCTPTACSVSETLSLRDTGTSVLLEMLCWVACDCPPPPQTECPLCREKFLPQKLVYLRHYR